MRRLTNNDLPPHSVSDHSMSNPMKTALIGLATSLTLASGYRPAHGQATDDRIEEVIVTAQYREERIQDVPVSISVFTGEDLAALRVDTPADLARVTPGLFMNRSSVNQSDPEFTLRGIGTNDSSTNQNPATPIYVDGVTVPFNAMVGHVLFDMQRVEVLKGPQGTLYGRNSTGGAVNFISRRPGGERDANFSVSYGERNRTDVEAGFTLPLSDTFSIRLAGVVAQEDGWQTIDLSDYTDANDPNFLDPTRRNGDIDREAFRVSALWQPSDTVEILSVFDAGFDNGEVLAFKHAGNVVRDNPTELCSYAITGVRNETECASFAYDSRTADLIPVTIGGLNLFVQDANNRGELVAVSDPNVDPYTTIKNFSLGSDIDSEAYGFTTQINWSRGLYDITSLTGFRTFERQSGYGQQGGPFATIGGRLHNDIDVAQQEFRISSDEFSDRLYWVAGLFFSKEDIFNSNIQNLAEHELFSAIFNDAYTQETDVLAAFGQVEWDLTNQWQLTGGLRFTSEDRSFDLTGQMVGFGPVIVPEYSEEVDSSEVTWRAGINYRPQEDLLLYASASKGFRGKGFPASIAFSIPQLLPFDQETLFAYEAGFKSTLFAGDVVLNGSFYYYDFEDFQAQTAVDREGIRLIVLTNAGDARVIGGEADLRWYVTPELSWSAGINVMEAEVISGEFDGDSIARSPDVMLHSLLRYDAEKSYGGFTPFAQVDVSYKSEMDFILPNHPGATEDGYWLFNARAGFVFPDPNWEVSVWAQNIGDELYHSEVFGPGSTFLPAGILYGPPSAVGVTVEYSY
jgi:iron complex outermembrane recepter protein